ncbi:YaaC family protein [Brevibacillus dissolubilis]|uniref:YaaC family protein n=1 Tax=Brevibacillus dissolubilis TaxID=1844116 RepID=UPI00111643C0|nr:YaaC family protein [Brevibacillus dissolubilis]
MIRSVWDSLRYLETEPTARKFLTQSYSAHGLEHPERHAFQQSNRFLYTWKQARAYYDAASRSDLLIRPMLLFYGCVHLLKGLLIAKDPLYPQNSRMLQHGVTTRKIKKNPYQLLEDEIRPQKEGLFAYLADVRKLSPLQDRYTTSQLFSFLPDLLDDYYLVTGEKSNWLPVDLAQHPENRDHIQLRFPDGHTGALAYSPETFLHYLSRTAPEELVPFLRPEDVPAPSMPLQDPERIISAPFQKADKPDNQAPIPKTYKLDNQASIPKTHMPAAQAASTLKTFKLPLQAKQLLNQHPLFTQCGQGQLYFWNHHTPDPPLPVWAAHYLLLYLFGMLCRYETEWWGELTLSHSYAEIYLVEKFLKLHEHSFPHMLLQELNMTNS